MKNFKFRNLLKPYFLIPICIIAFVLFDFAFWYLMPAKSLRIAVVDKTVPATAADNASYLGDVSNNYRKHIGLNWLLDYMKVKNPDTGKYYDYTTDYYGHKLDENGNIEKTDSITSIKETPDIVYLADTYGVEINEDRGLSEDEMNAVSMCHSSGSVVIGEQDIMTTATSDKVRSQLESLFGIKSTGWVGRYIYDLADLTDVPYWAPDMWQAKYGQEWKCSGPGILLVSRDGDILVLEEKTDFKSKNLFNISIESKYKKEFGKHSVNFYNWFELIEADGQTETIATFSFNVNSTGAEELAAVSNTTTFAAVTRKTDENLPSTYYFAGDFNDYVTNLQIHNFCFADLLFRSISFNRDGDVTHFYWNFYEPMMKKIINDVAKNPIKDEEKQTEQNSRINGDSFEIKVGDDWQKFTVKGFNINGEMPGDGQYEYSRDYESYLSLINSVKDMNGNCIRTYDILPPEFYRALSEVNRSLNAPIYLLQGVMTPTDVTADESIAKREEIKKNISEAIKAVHGNGNVLGYGNRETMSYNFDVAKYCIGYVIDPKIDGAAADRLIADNADYKYDGEYISGSRNAVEALSAELCDHALKSQKDICGYMIPVSVRFDGERLEGAGWAKDQKTSFNVTKLEVKDSASKLFFASYSLSTDDYALLNSGSKYNGYTDESGSLQFGGYIHEAKALFDKPTLLDRVGLSTNTNMYDKESSINGLSEKQQGEGVVRMLKAASNEGYLGSLISDLNDNWSAVSSDMSKFTIPSANSGLWQNTADRAQTSGIVAADSNDPEEVSMELNDSGAMQQMQLSSNRTYVYVTLLLKEEINFDEREMILGIDTYQRNNGEYFYDKGYYANSLSGMEFIVKFESKSAASLYVVSSYDRNRGKYASAESYNASYDFVSALKYGDFASSNTHFYQTGMTVHLRIPWAMLNFTDPSSRLVINGTKNGLVQTTATEGMIFSLLIGDRNTMDTAYIFPESKQQAGYKTFKLSGWDKTDVKYTLREKDSAAIIKRYFDSVK